MTVQQDQSDQSAAAEEVTCLHREVIKWCDAQCDNLLCSCVVHILLNYTESSRRASEQSRLTRHSEYTALLPLADKCFTLKLLLINLLFWDTKRLQTLQYPWASAVVAVVKTIRSTITVQSGRNPKCFWSNFMSSSNRFYKRWKLNSSSVLMWLSAYRRWESKLTVSFQERRCAQIILRLKQTSVVVMATPHNSPGDAAFISDHTDLMVNFLYWDDD